MTCFSTAATTATWAAATSLVMGLAGVGPAHASEALADQKLCLNCHKVDKAQVGPSFKDVAARYAGQKDAANQLAERIQKGSVPKKGNWGAVPMPANPQVSPADAKLLATWVLGLK